MRRKKNLWVDKNYVYKSKLFVFDLIWYYNFITIIYNTYNTRILTKNTASLYKWLSLLEYGNLRQWKSVSSVIIYYTAPLLSFYLPSFPSLTSLVHFLRKTLRFLWTRQCYATGVLHEREYMSKKYVKKRRLYWMWRILVIGLFNLARIFALAQFGTRVRKKMNSARCKSPNFIRCNMSALV